MPDDVAEEKVKALQALGAEVQKVRPASIVDKKQVRVKILQAWSKYWFKYQYVVSQPFFKVVPHIVWGPPEPGKAASRQIWTSRHHWREESRIEC